LADLQKWVDGPGKPLSHQGSDRFDLFIGNRDAMPSNAYNSEHSINTTYAEALLAARGKLDENVTIE